MRELTLVLGTLYSAALLFMILAVGWLVLVPIDQHPGAGRDTNGAAVLLITIEAMLVAGVVATWRSLRSLRASSAIFVGMGILGLGVEARDRSEIVGWFGIGALVLAASTVISAVAARLDDRRRAHDEAFERDIKEFDLRLATRDVTKPLPSE